jgi:hypothetical protein
MSAWIVSKTHIDVLVRGLIEAGGYYHRGVWQDVNADNASDVGRMLWRENFKSINHRYSEHKSTPPYTYETPDAYISTSRQWGNTKYLEDQSHVDRGVLAKQVHCYNYQTCEHETYYKSRAFSVVLYLCYEAASHVQGYEEAKWGV